MQCLSQATDKPNRPRAAQWWHEDRGEVSEQYLEADVMSRTEANPGRIQMQKLPNYENEFYDPQLFFFSISILSIDK
jgi:hypothetical protein